MAPVELHASLQDQVLSYIRNFPNSACDQSLLYGLALVGVVSVFSLTASFLRLLSTLTVCGGYKLTKFGPKGSWAVITGASDGLGKEFALQIAAKGFNVVLVSRTASKLQALASEISEKYKVETRTVAMDFAKNDDSDYARLAQEVNNLDVSILVNNVGKSHDIPVPFAETDLNEMKDIININCHGTLRVTSLVIPGMMERKRGLILTMGSFGGLFPTPLLATYSGSKAFLQQWSTALGSELAPYNIKTELVLSYLVTSAMSKIRKSSALIPNPKNFVKSTLGSIGAQRGAKRAGTNTPYWTHAVMHWAIESFVGIYSGVALNVNKGFHVDIRKRALRKREREAKKQ
ncbi:NAD(P)-binding protein [Ascobolus immersus RN42]|uniref:Very-long-chain 3-oxoacyl-CoA reductase n=1 Tax=Ascobolus immersus RN42 TaxID=1160509 RepID=A0A3N4IC32_ASCIM|nr:NAD(P)-binding protein [Ascobolus immersus RN42]